MKPLLLNSWGTCLKTHENRLVVLDQDSGVRKEWLPVEFPFDSVIAERLGGFVTFPALHWLASNRIPLTILNFSGQVIACFLPDAPCDHPSDRLNQLAAYLNPAARLAAARFILEAKVGEVPFAYRTWDDLLTFEGRQATRYWAALGIRRDNPHARDPTNAVINYSFGLLASRARIAIHRAGLDPTIGFLHVPQNYKLALVYDVMEPFRDSTVRSALAARTELKSRDFGEVFGHGLKLRPQGASKLVHRFSGSFPEKEMDSFTRRLTLKLGVLRDRFSPCTETTLPALPSSGSTARAPAV